MAYLAVELPRLTGHCCPSLPETESDIGLEAINKRIAQHAVQAFQTRIERVYTVFACSLQTLERERFARKRCGRTHQRVCSGTTGSSAADEILMK